ncbi:hypothetical protein J14TS2_08030 [Bacillus sp. J14TS2]|uniref:sensor histidine kinase n=1 Tax=Bacillus sp. J14TS2 TaxID=2807188 RepID=UPI001B2E3000|nr:HAMP domain-containing sensor histidine kinase [Bacillus sp. J14TS2]GIN70328.1 hypothetical protein J14TS2_08030 [Bacillus sp. J14TS2]
MNKRKSLVFKYLLIIIASILMWPVLPAIYYLPGIVMEKQHFYDTMELEAMWDQTAEELQHADSQTIHMKLSEIQEQYPQAEMFWIDAAGESHFLNKVLTDIPDQWTHTSLVQFIDAKKKQDLFTVTAMIDYEKENQGIIIFYIPISNTTLSLINTELYLNLIFIITGISIIFVSLLFFITIRKRLVRLSSAMSDTGHTMIPDRVPISNSDEIGQLENAFNEMVDKLKSSRQREIEETNFRKDWVANISHDLRAPLTVIRQHAYTIQSHPSSPKAKASIQIIIHKLSDIEKLLEKMFTYTLLSAGKHPFHRENVDVVEHLQHIAIEWYPVLEKEEFQIDIDLPDQPLYWDVDPLWLRCILDNLIQNVIRYAKSGQYIGMGFVEQNGTISLFIKDRGGGIAEETRKKGAGIGLSIVTLMTKEMSISWEVSSSSQGTIHYLSQSLPS